MITRNGAQFDYAPDGQRWRQVSSYASGNETTNYVAGLLKELPTRAVTRYMECDQVADSEAEGWRHVCLLSYGTSFCRCLSTGRSWPILRVCERPLLPRRRVAASWFSPCKVRNWEQDFGRCPGRKGKRTDGYA
jgi:hypothetical protein